VRLRPRLPGGSWRQSAGVGGSVSGGAFEWRWRECSASVVGGNWRCGVWGERFVLGFVEGEGRGSDLGGVSVRLIEFGDEVGGSGIEDGIRDRFGVVTEGCVS
jgi:hypothetical protein